MSTRHDWSKHCYARLLIDNHISEDDPAFMTKFDPAQYVAMAKQAGVESSMVYAVCHNGNSYYPTQVGSEALWPRCQNRRTGAVLCLRRRIEML